MSSREQCLQLKFKKFYLCLCDVLVGMRRSGDSLRELVPSFQHVESRDDGQVVRSGEGPVITGPSHQPSGAV